MDRWWFWSFRRDRWEESIKGEEANTRWGRISTYGVTVYASEKTRDSFRDAIIQVAMPYGNPEGKEMGVQE